MKFGEESGVSKGEVRGEVKGGVKGGKGGVKVTEQLTTWSAKTKQQQQNHAKLT